MPVRLDDADGAEKVLVDPPAASGPREHLGRRAGELSLDEPNPLRPGGPVAIRGGRAPGVRAVADGVVGRGVVGARLPAAADNRARTGLRGAGERVAPPTARLGPVDAVARWARVEIGPAGRRCRSAV